MKRLLLIMLLLLTAFQGFSQSKGISYQAVILNPNPQEIPGQNAQGNILANSAVSIEFSIINSSGTEEYQEQHSTRTDRYGMINLLIGTGAPTGSNDFSDIFWNGTVKKLKVAIDFTGGSNFSPLSEQNLTYMPQPPTQETTIEITNNTAAIATERTRAQQAEQNNATGISTLQTEQATQNTAIALNTAKVGVTPAQASTIGNTTGINTGDQDISGIAINSGAITTLKSEQTAQNTAIALNTLKVSYPGDQDISGIATNATDISTLKTEQTTQNAAIGLNTAKTGITAQQASDITVNNAKVSDINHVAASTTTDLAEGTNLYYTEARVSANTNVAANTLKTGITPAQATAITANTTHLGLTDNPHNLTKTQIGLGNVENTKVNLSATIAPALTDDTASGYSVGSRWIDVTNDKEYVCVDATATAAVWVETTGGSSSNYAGTSSTSIDLSTYGDCSFQYPGCGSGTVTLTTNEVLAYTAGMRVRLAETSNPTTQYLEGMVSTYDGSAMEINVDGSYGGVIGTTSSNWNINLGAGLPGVPGPIGEKGEGYGGTSTTSNDISIGAKTFTLDNTYYAYSVGMRVRFSNSATNYVEGIVTSYDNSLYDISITVDHILGAGTFTDWTVGIAGDPGVAGEKGEKGDPGDSGAIYTIGLSAEQGGYIFWVSADGKHGLVAETIDQGITTWYEAQNAISNPANHSTNGQNFRDWRLPTKFELNEMYTQKAAIGNFSNDFYWSSTEDDNYDAWGQSFGSGVQFDFFKYVTSPVRAVRAF